MDDNRPPDKLPNSSPASATPPRRRGRPLTHPENDLRSKEELEWWIKNVAEPTAAKRRPLPLANIQPTEPPAPQTNKLPDLWLFDSETLLNQLDRCREMVLLIPTPTHESLFALNIAVSAIWDLTQHLRFLLHLHREGQRAFSKKHNPTTPGKRAQKATTLISAPARTAKKLG